MILAPAQGNSEYFELNVYLKRLLHDAWILDVSWANDVVCCWIDGDLYGGQL